MADSVDIRELHENLREYLDRAKAGEDFVISDRGHAFARLMPVDPGYADLAARFGATIPTARLEEIAARLPARTELAAGAHGSDPRRHAP